MNIQDSLTTNLESTLFLNCFVKKGLLAYITVMYSASLCHSDPNKLYLPIFPFRQGEYGVFDNNLYRTKVEVGFFLWLKSTVEFHQICNSLKSSHSCCRMLALINTYGFIYSPTHTCLVPLEMAKNVLQWCQLLLQKRVSSPRYCAVSVQN